MGRYITPYVGHEVPVKQIAPLAFGALSLRRLQTLLVKMGQRYQST
jgi:hypothetical protein